MRALPISIFEDKKIGNCSNDGISSRYKEVLLVCESGFIEVDENNPPENLVKVVTRHLFGKEYKHIEPVARPTGCGWCLAEHSYTVVIRDSGNYPTILYHSMIDRKRRNNTTY